MKLEVLVAAVNAIPEELAERMRLDSDAIIVNQCDHYEYSEFQRNYRKIRVFSMAERGVGLSRNTALLRGEGDILLFGDDDICYDEDYEENIIEAFEQNPDADGITFNLEVDPRRKTYENTRERRIRFYNYGRYPTYALAVRADSIRRANVCFSLLFGGGARYSNGEDSLFFHDCLKKGLHLYASTRKIGKELYRESSWFDGYHEKFFYDRGFLYAHLYGKFAHLWALRFLLAKRATILTEHSLGEAFSLMCRGIQDGKSRKDCQV